MEFDLKKVTYSIVAVMPDGSRLFLSDLCESMGWEENKSELAGRLNLSIRDVSYNGSRLAQKLPLCTVIYLFSDWGQGEQEVWRGTVWEWEFSGIDGDSIRLTCYDMLYYLNKSQVNKYYEKGTMTKSIVTDLCKDWKIPMGVYKGPNVKHGKLLFRGKTVAAILSDVLSDAEDLGAVKCFIRAGSGKIDILPYGTNDEVFILESGTQLSTSDRYSMTELVTRVIITGKEDKQGRPKVEATINGKTQYGILQVIQTKGSGDMADAKKAANKLLKERGEPKRTTTLRCIDMPKLRKGDKVSIKEGLLNGMFHVMGISHDGQSRTMNLEVEPV